VAAIRGGSGSVNVREQREQGRGREEWLSEECVGSGAYCVGGVIRRGGHGKPT
jgi:hypothetical protein